MMLNIFRVVLLLLVFGQTLTKSQSQEHIQDPAQKLLIYTEQLPPFNYQIKGKTQGIVVDIVRECLKRQGSPQQPIHLLPWDRAYDLALKQDNSMLFSVSRLPHREDLFQWVGPISSYHMVLLARKGSHLKIENWDDIRSIDHIAVAPNTAAANYLEKLNFNNLDYHPKHQLNTIKLLSGRVGLLIDTFETSQYFSRSNQAPEDAIKAVAHLYTGHFYLAFARATPATVIKQWQKTLQAMREDGSYEAIASRYPPTQSTTTVRNAHFKNSWA